MYFRTLRRLTADNLHNMDTGLKWFQGNLYVAYRQGDAHVCPYGKLIVQRSRDRGENFEYVAVGRGAADTRDAHLYAVGDQRLYLVGFESGGVNITGTMWTDNGVNWSPWTRFTGANGWWLWHPEYFNGKYYCAGYGEWDRPNHSAAAWFESDNGVDWRWVCTLHEGADQPNEASLAFQPDGTAVMLLRCERQSKHPLLLRAAPPYAKWDKVELDIPLAGPNLWFVDGQIWIAGRWFISRRHAHQAIFKLVNDRPEMQVVLPSGPNPDFGYMSVAQWPQNKHRYAMAYYSNHTAPEDRSVNQWNHPDIYLADVVFEAPFIERWLVSELVETERGLQDAACPDPAVAGLAWKPMTCMTEGSEWDTPGLVDAHTLIDGRAGIVYFVADLEIGPVDRGVLHLGYDGPIRVWLNGRQVFEGEGTNPAEVDTTSLPVETQHGGNRLCIALDTHGGKAWGIIARFEAA